MPEDKPEIQELREEISKYRGLVNTPGWEWLAGAAQDDVDQMLQSLVTTPRDDIGEDKILSWVFQLGEIAAIKRHFDKPQLALGTAEALLEQLMQRQREEDARRDTGDDPGNDDPGIVSP